MNLGVVTKTILVFHNEDMAMLAAGQGCLNQMLHHLGCQVSIVRMVDFYYQLYVNGDAIGKIELIVYNLLMVVFISHDFLVEATKLYEVINDVDLGAF